MTTGGTLKIPVYLAFNVAVKAATQVNNGVPKEPKYLKLRVLF